MKPISITYTGRPITKKNHQQIRKNMRTGARFVAQSDKYKEYEMDCLWQTDGCIRNIEIDEPVNIKCVYYMPTHGIVDLSNLIEATCDILTRAGVIADDNSRIVAGHDGSRVLYDKQNPRVVIDITPMNESQQEEGERGDS